MPLTRNAVYLEENEEYISIVIKMVHPKKYRLILISLVGISVICTLSLIVVFNIFAELGRASFALLTIGSLVSFYFFKIYMWHARGEEFFLLTIDNFTHQINNGIKLSELKSYDALNYKLGFAPTGEYESMQVGNLLIYTIDPKTKLKSFLLQSTLEITFEEYEFIAMKYMNIREESVQKIINFNLN